MALTSGIGAERGQAVQRCLHEPVFKHAIPCVQLMVDKIIGDGYTVDPAPQKGHRLLSVEHERTEGRSVNDLGADPRQVFVPEQPDQALEC